MIAHLGALIANGLSLTGTTSGSIQDEGNGARVSQRLGFGQVSQHALTTTMLINDSGERASATRPHDQQIDLSALGTLESGAGYFDSVVLLDNLLRILEGNGVVVIEEFRLLGECRR